MDERGYYEKFTVVRNSSGEEITGFRFVLIPGPPSNDLHARAALEAYAKSCEPENPALADELRTKLSEL